MHYDSDLLSNLVHGRFEVMAARFPHREALWARGESLTYQTLNQRANQLARVLTARGVGPETLVGICLHRTHLLPTAMLAVLKAGGAYVPLDPAYPRERIGYTMEDSRASLLLTESKLAEGLRGTGADLLLVDQLFAPETEALSNPSHRSLPTNTAYVLFTSGSTGRPKGVAIAHTSVTALLDWAQTEYSDEQLAHVLAATSVCFDLSIFEIFLTLSRGGRVVLVDNALALADVTTQVTLVNTVPSAVRELLRSGGIPQSVVTVNLAGEPLRNDLVQGLYNRGHITKVYNLYGPSEDTTYSTFTLCPQGVEEDPTIGVAVGGSEVLLLDEQGTPVPAGDAGELCMAGEGLARGYLHRPSLTAAKFTPHPTAHAGSRPGARLYHTGDLSRCSASGDYLFLGRIDHQVKIRGFRIELGEIESALRKHDLVAETVVTAQETPTGDKLLVGYIQTLGADSPADAPPPDVDTVAATAELRRHLAGFLPDYMIPAVFVFMPRFPLTPNGKIDRKALPAADLNQMGRRYDPPRNDLEARLAEAWAEALGRERIGIFDDFIELGGDSISAIRVIGAMRRAGVLVDQSTLFNERNIASIANHAATANAPIDEPILDSAAALSAVALSLDDELREILSLGGIDAARVTQVLPATSMQVAMMFHSSFNAASRTYVDVVHFTLPSSLDADRLHRAWLQCVERHAALRSLVITEGRQPCVVVLDRHDRVWHQDSEDTNDPAAIADAIAAERARGVEPYEPPFRLRLMRGHDAAWHLLFVFHHAILDGWSIPILLADATQFYNQTSPSLPEPPSFAVYLAWLASRQSAPAEAHWRERLGDFDRCPPLLGQEPNALRSVAQDEHAMPLAHQLMEDLQRFGNQRGLTLNSLFLGMWCLIVARCTDSLDVVVGTTAGGRPAALPDVDHMVGMFLNNLPLRTKMARDTAVLSWLRDLQDTAVADRAYEWYPLADIQTQSGIERGQSLFECAFTFENYPANQWLDGGFLGSTSVVEYEETGIPLALKVELGSQPRLVLQYARDRFDQADASAFMDRMRDLCALLCHRPSSTLGEFLDLAHPGVAQRETIDQLLTEEADPDAPPRDLATPTEQQLAALWRDVLAVDEIHANSHFFHLGGHSLLANRMMFLIERQFGKRLPIQTLFETPLLSRLAEKIDSCAAGDELRQGSVADGDAVPLSYGQERLWFLQKMQPEAGYYNVPAAYEITGPLDVDRLVNALEAVAARHGSLRTQLVLDEQERPRQVMLTNPSYDIVVEDWSSRDEAALQRALDEDANRAFRLTAGMLWRARICRLSTERTLLYVNVHHIITDGWSQGVFCNDLAAAYAGETLAPLTWQYADEALLNRARMQGERAATLRGFWQRALADAPSELALRTDRPRPTLQTFVAGEYVRTLDEAILQRLGEAMRGIEVTPFMVLSAAYALLLSRYADQRDVCIGTAVAGREHSQAEELIGFFVNTLVLRYRTHQWHARREMFNQSRAIVTAAMAHQDMPFEELVDLIKPERNPARSPLFQALFTLESHSSTKPVLAGLETDHWALSFPVAKFELSLVIQKHGERYDAHWEYNRDLYDERTVARMARHYEQLLAALADNPKQAPAELDFLTAAEHHDLLRTWNDTTRPLPSQSTQHALFAANVAQRGTHPAVIDPEQTTTYAALDAEANRLAHWLRDHGIGPADRVGLSTAQDVTMPLLMLAVLKVGGVYVPMDSQLPEPRLVSMCEDANIAMVFVADEDRHGKFPVDQVFTVEQARAEAAQCSAEPVNQAMPSNALSNIMFTSGSTGRPKAVGICHHGVIRLVCSQDYLEISPDDVIPQIATMGFDASTMEIWGALLNGATLVTLPSRAMETVPDLLVTRQVTLAFLTTRFFNLLVEDHRGCFDGVHHVITGGEAMSLRHAEAFVKAQGETKLIQAYGPTENSVFTSTSPVTSTSATAFAEPIGLPLSNTTAHLVDRHCHLVPVGVPGELVTGGLGLAHGYLQQPSRTAAVFIPDPFSTDPGGRLYRTGDLAVRLADGRLEFHGRIDQQVKLRGFRIEPAEVETVLKRHPAVAKAACLVLADRTGDQFLMAYLITAQGEEQPTGDVLKEWVGQHLPPYMVPSFITWLADYPLTANGKLDARQLPGPDTLRAEQGESAGSLAPTEATVAEVWSQVLGLATVRAQDNFFDLGGHSLAMIQVHTALKKHYGADLAMVKLFEYPTVAGLAKYLDRQRAAVSSEEPAANQADKKRAEARKQALKRRRTRR